MITPTLLLKRPVSVTNDWWVKIYIPHWFYKVYRLYKALLDRMSCPEEEEGANTILKLNNSTSKTAAD